MTHVDDLVTWLREQIAEDRSAALAARAEWGDEDGDRDSDWEEWKLSGKLADAGWYDPEPRGLDRHWQLHSPRAVLAQCDAHEGMLEFLLGMGDEAEQVALVVPSLGEKYRERFEHGLKLLASGRQHRPGYREEWRLC